MEVEARSSGHVLEAVVFERDMASWVVRDDKSGDGRQCAELMISCGGGLAKVWVLEGGKGAVGDEI